MRRRHHRQFGLPNANQILLCMVVCALLFFALLRRHWLQFADDPDVHASLKSVYVVGEGPRTPSRGSSSAPTTRSR